jgi:hypothetical protein
MSRNWILVVVICALALGSCRSNDAKVPQNLLPLPEMRSVISDLLMSESYVQMHPMRIDSERIVSNQLFTQVAARHKLTKRQLYDNLQYYSSHPEIMNEGYKPLADSLSAMEARLH